MEGILYREERDKWRDHARRTAVVDEAGVLWGKSSETGGRDYTPAPKH